MDLKAPKVKSDSTRLEKAQIFLAEGEYDSCGNELRKEAEELLNKHIQNLNNVAETGRFTTLSEKITNIFKKLTEDERISFNKLFINKKIPLEIIKKIKEDYQNDETLGQDKKGQLNCLKNELFNYLIRQYEIRDNKSALENDLKDDLIRVMNPASHGGNTPLYRDELKKAADGIVKLKNLLDRESLEDEVTNQIGVEVNT